MILPWLVFIPVIGGLLAWFGGARGGAWSRWISLVVLLADLVLLIVFVTSQPAVFTSHGTWLAEADWAWVPWLGIRFHLAMDGLSLLLVILTLALGILSVAASWTEIGERPGLFHLNLLWTLAGVVGVFLALDLLLFFFFWELMLIPMYFVILLWGHEHRNYAAIKFFLFTQGGGLLMFITIVALFLVHLTQTGNVTFDYFDLAATPMGPTLSMWLMLGFFIAFAVKLPALPLHTWLPDAHTEAPTAGSVILAGLLLKTGAYGLLRFAIPLFPQASLEFAPIAMGLGVAGILYGAMLAFAQDDMKRLIAYTSISHLGFVLIGIYAWTPLALQGAVMQMLAHGVSTGALFILVGALQERLHTRDMRRLGGLWANMPRMAAICLYFAIASLGLPGLGNFAGEFLVLLGAFGQGRVFTIVATSGLVVAVIYALIFIQRVFQGERRIAAVADLSPHHMMVMAIMMAAILWLGVYPQPVFDIAAPGLDNVSRAAGVDFRADAGGERCEKLVGRTGILQVSRRGAAEMAAFGFAEAPAGCRRHQSIHSRWRPAPLPVSRQ